MDKIAYQKEMEKLFHKNQLIPRIKREFITCKEMDFEAYMNAKEIPVEFGFDLLTQMVLHKRVKIGVIVGILRKHFDNSQETVDNLYKAAEANLVDWSPLTEQFIIRIGISEDVQEEIDKYQYPLPMIVEPQKIHRNDQSAYLTGGGSVILKNNHHDDDVCLDHLNKVNAVKFRINHITATMIKNEWKNLDKPKEDEEYKDYQKRVKQFEKYDRTAKDVMMHLEVADNEFYLTHKYDKRGRIYCQGYHVNYQGTPWNKAVIEFVEGELVQ
ncbi:RNAP1-like RNA polymerase protein [Rhizobium phage RHph_X2_28B]|uniref:RNAP1-like RNA polymerase protein n=1 Tax=Rhizobium phage RHph_X2_28B TaxID=2836086 RepID=UPI002329352F|nr:RNAP1-like RNA polymerase protein [Rhizobium phage RHph_X2_28B]QWY83480.1 RNAP1-like RNA polymerase protein [Rhizobium phage RHph_X2_28B]QWY83716.1 RNAP1-like RNA polymerase protein [Rhizobium phage RHph_X3_15]